MDTAETDSLREHRRHLKEKRIKMTQREPSATRDIAGVVALIFSLTFLLALSSFDPNDPSIFNDTSKFRANNLLGLVGAHLSAVMMEAFGFCSFIFPFAMGYGGYQMLRAKRGYDILFQWLGGSITALCLLIFFGSFSPVLLKGVPLAPGGYAGVELWSFLSRYLNAFGTYFLLLVISGFALLLATQVTLHDAYMWLGRNLLRLVEYFADLYRAMRRRQEDANRTKRHEKVVLKQMAAKEPGDKRQAEEQGLLARIGNFFANLKAQWAKQEEWEDEEIHFEEDVEPELGPAAQTKLHKDVALRQEPERLADAEPEPEPVPQPKARPAPKAAAAQTEQEPQPGDVVVNKPKSNRPFQESFSFVNELNNDWVFPNSSFFMKPQAEHKIDEAELKSKALQLKEKFEEFNVTGDMREIHPGPVVTTYEFRPDAGIKYSKVVNLQDDLCLALGAESVRIDRMSGRSSIGLEVPNDKRELITFREMVESEKFIKEKAKLLVTLGKTIDGTPMFANLAKMPHLLIAGQTGAGKSVGLNAMICSLLMRMTPQELKLIMIDPKMVEMGVYADIPHLLTPVVTDPLEASNALKWAVTEMELRYRLLAAHSVRNIDQFNQGVISGKIAAEEGDEPLTSLPFIVVVIDEMADLMMVARGEVEESVARIAQKSRAVGIHLILATQRPSVDIITGVIKSNLPSRLSYRVSQRNDSRIILDANGAEKLLGKGDGLYLGPGTSRLVRIHAPFLSESEVIDLVKFLKHQGSPDYNHSVLKQAEDLEAGAGAGGKSRSDEDPMYDKAVRLVVRSGQASVSYLQRKLSLGYARAAKLVDMMEEEGIVGPNQGSKARDILVSSDYFDEVDAQIR